MEQVSSPPLSSPPAPPHPSVSPRAGSRRPFRPAVREDLHLRALLPRARAEPGGHAPAAGPLPAAPGGFTCGGPELPAHLPGAAVPAAAAGSPGRKVLVSMEIRVRKTATMGCSGDCGENDPLIASRRRMCFYFEIYSAHPVILLSVID